MHETTSAKLSDDDPLMEAYNAWKEGDDYRNARGWAEYCVLKTVHSNAGTIVTSVEHPHTEGSLWGAFTAGYRAGQFSAK